MRGFMLFSSKVIFSGVVFISAILILSFSFGCSHSGKTEPITISTIPYEKSALIYIAEARKYFASNGLDIKIKDYETGVAAVDAIIKGDAEIAACSEFVVVGKIQTGEKIAVISSIGETQDDYIMVRADRGINKASDLKGKKIGLVRKTAAEFYLGRFLDLHGMNMRQLRIVDIKATEFEEAIMSGDFDAIVTWQPYAFQLKRKLGNKIALWPVQSSQLMYWNIVGTRDWLSTHREKVKRVLNLSLRRKAIWPGTRRKQGRSCKKGSATMTLISLRYGPIPGIHSRLSRRS